MSVPIYTPFFLHPTANGSSSSSQKKRANARKRVSYPVGSSTLLHHQLQQQEQQQQLEHQDCFGSIIDTRSRKPTAANGNGECLVLPEEASPSRAPPTKRLMVLQSLRLPELQPLQQPPGQHKRPRMTILVAPNNTIAAAASTSSDQSQHAVIGEEELTEEHGLDDIAAEVEVNVEDDVEEQTTLPHHQHPNHPHHSKVSMNKFNPDSCFDAAELRRQLHLAYDRIHQMAQTSSSSSGGGPPQHQHQLQQQQRLKSENYYLRNEVSQCEQRISQLESIVLERNMRLKQLLSENVFLSARLKRIQSEFGVDAVKEIFNRE